MDISGDEIADTVLKQFHALPQKRKPQTRSDFAHEWVPLSGIVAQGQSGLRCIALGTGMKCLPGSKIPLALGAILHDWHAEVVALRSLNRFLLEECYALAKQENSEYVRYRTGAEITEKHFQPFALKDDIKLHMYCSEAPCGDASMELTMAAQDDSTPWDLPAPLSDELPTDEHSLHGRGYFSILGIVRRKPSRSDAPPTLSKSCSDKLSQAQCISILRGSASLLLSPSNLYLSSLTLPFSQYSQTACTRAFSPSGRMANLSESKIENWKGSGYRFLSFEIVTTQREFEFSRRQNIAGKLVPSNLATAWMPRAEETIIGGVLQGHKQFDLRGASLLSKRRMWSFSLRIAAIGGMKLVHEALNVKIYSHVKESQLMKGRRLVKSDVRKDGLKGWVRSGGDEFEIDMNDS